MSDQIVKIGVFPSHLVKSNKHPHVTEHCASELSANQAMYRRQIKFTGHKPNHVSRMTKCQLAHTQYLTTSPEYLKVN